ncbi:hypothetical protein [Paucihalobacter sp.]|uniref:hypothetical protein n=1 Tax=Paucihalobacter sp. TaxID=2850405 RepID=UPI002FE0EFD6
MKKGFLFISCEEAMHICDKAQYGEATWWEKVELKIRLSWCHFTKGYAKKNTLLTTFINQQKVECLQRKERDLLQQVLEQELKQQQ